LRKTKSREAGIPILPGFLKGCAKISGGQSMVALKKKIDVHHASKYR
jgi:hypothetical protein